MAIDKCSVGAVLASGQKLTKKEADQMQEDIKSFGNAARRKLGPNASADEVTREAGRMAKSSAEAGAYIERRNKLMNLAKRQQRDAFYKSMSPSKLAKGIQAKIRGINTPGDMNKLSAQGMMDVKHAQYLTAMHAELERGGIDKAVYGGKNDVAIGKELAELSKPEGERQVGVSKNDVAVKAAAVIRKYQNLAKQDLNGEGAAIGNLDSYVAHQNHDPVLIRSGGRSEGWKPFKMMSSDEGFSKWRDFISPLLDHDKTFGGRDADKILRGVYNGLVTGVHLSSEGSQGFKDPSFSGPGNMAKRLSQERFLHFKDADSDARYQQEYGVPRLVDRVASTLRASARDFALMRTWGTNPRAEFEADMRRLNEHYVDKDQDAVNSLQTKQRSLQNEFDHLDGTAMRPEYQLNAKMWAGFRTVEALSKLGNVLFTHLSVGMTKGAELRYHGMGFLEAQGNFYKSFADGRSAAERAALATELHTRATGGLHYLTSMFQPSDAPPGALSRTADTFYKMTGLEGLFKMQRNGTLYQMAENLGQNVSKDFSKIDPEYQKTLQQYGIGPKEWDLIRSSENHIKEEGRTYVTPGSMEGVDRGDIKQYLQDTGSLKSKDKENVVEAKIDQAKQELALRLNVYFEDSARRAMITPGVAERALLLQGTRPGSVVGEFARSLAQFKMWPTALMMQGLGREFSRAGSLGQGVAHTLVNMIVPGMVYGYARMVAADLTAGKDVRDPSDPKTWVAALTQGGGIGIMGDFLFGQEDRFGASPLVTAAGPMASDVDALYKMYNQLKSDALDPNAKKDVLPEALRFGVNHIPFSNLFYARAALNYLVMWRVYEAMNPGWAGRYEQKLQKENGQTMWLRPTQAVGQ